MVALCYRSTVLTAEGASTKAGTPLSRQRGERLMEPTYPLDRIRSLVGQEGEWLITLTAQQTALQIGYDEQDVVECIQETLDERGGTSGDRVL